MRKCENRIFSIITCFVMCFTFCINDFASMAAIGKGESGTDFTVPYSKPEGDGVGYCAIVVEKAGTYYLDVVVLQMTDFSEDSSNTTGYSNSGVAVAGFENGYVYIECGNGSETNYVYFSMWRYLGSSDKVQYYDSGLLATSGMDGDVCVWTINYVGYGYTVVGYELGGIFGLGTKNALTTFKAPTIYWGADGALYDIMNILMKNQSMYELYFPKLNQMNLNISQIRQLLEEMKTMSEEDENKSEQLVASTSNKKGELDSVGKESKVDKVDSVDASNNVDSNIDFDSVGNYGVLLSTITSNKNVLQLIMIVLSVATVSYVLFGKR